MSKKAKPKQEGKERPAENKTGTVAQRNKDDRTSPNDDSSGKD
jgi:hypothetical protein